MTNKEYSWTSTQGLILLAVGLLVGAILGGLIVSLRYNAEIRTDQLELKAKVEEIIESKAVIDDLIQKLIFHIEQIKVEWRELRDLQERLSKGE